MEFQDYFRKMKYFQKNILDFIECSSNVEENFQGISFFFNDHNIREDSYALKAILHLILKISNNHYRDINFFDKIEKLILLFKDEISKFYSNYEIFDIFKSNKRILLFLFKEKILIPDSSIACVLMTKKYKEANYQSYFYTEFKSFFNFHDEEIEKDLESFENHRKIGENDNNICELIRNDLLDDFITYTTNNNIMLSSSITQSIFETNPFLIRRKQTLIEYASFYGSIQIFNYLYKNHVYLPDSLWLYAIHSQNFDLIQLFIDLSIKPKESFQQKCLIESIKCHHIDITNMIISNLIENSKVVDQIQNYHCLKNYNFLILQEDLSVEIDFCELCKNDYLFLIDQYLQNIRIDESSKRVF